ncbi:plant intracellular Ras-group-related LRR protein 5-like [Melanaphis sacchari]|uniref:plant intracellular Ras-group-related LRR protein 5-like n=1 Tax=Melanaphis sacchari TaxID=742174 RepID=UPI000DC13F3A|nr:plant intracellular Ras-group-related LRR protein 5-like [Melanaphis sacchari]
MLIRCWLAMQDLNPPRSKARLLKSCLMTNEFYNNKYLSVKNEMHPNIKKYKWTMLKKVYTKFIKDGKLGLEFTEPKQVLLIYSEEKSEVFMFYTELRTIFNDKKVKIGTSQTLKEVSANNFVMDCFDDSKTNEFTNDFLFENILSLKCLTVLLLAYCDLPRIPEEVGNLSIKYFSISGNALPTNQDTIWNWMTKTTICETLLILEMDYIGLKRLPFEITFLRNLQKLSISHNSLSYLPQSIVELKKLKSITVNGNSLAYLPHCLSSRVFNSIDISDNLFNSSRTQSYDHLLQYLSVSEIKIEDFDHVKPLSHLALFSLMDNCVPFKRQDIPRSLWIYFRLMGRCVFCMRWILPEYSQISFSHFSPRATELIQEQGTTNIPWQSMLCSIPNICTRPI